jgi:adenosylcobinamide-phosphate synthase
MTTALVLSVAMILDALLGEPDWLWKRFPHPAVIMGRLIGWCDAWFNTGRYRKAKGIGVLIFLVILASLAGVLPGFAGPVVEVVVVAILLAQRSLVDHVRAVADGLRLSLAQGRRSVAMIVSRDTKGMTPSAVVRSAIESAAENLSDGVIAPAFWFLVAGLPGLLIYKIVNTADSMIGYRTERYADFGWASARMDDVLNVIPARLTAALIALSAGAMGALAAIRRDAVRHRSPNAGWPEAAMARALDVALAGPRTYDGVTQDFAWVNEAGRKVLTAEDIDGAMRKMWQTWSILLSGVMAAGVLFSQLNP